MNVFVLCTFIVLTLTPVVRCVDDVPGFNCDFETGLSGWRNEKDNEDLLWTRSSGSVTPEGPVNTNAKSGIIKKRGALYTVDHNVRIFF